MKKIFYVITLILGCSVYGHSDSVTSGLPALIVITTGVVDVNRGWMDKINENFRMLSSTVNTLNTSLAPTSSTLQGNNVNITTTASGLNTINTTSSTLWLPLDGTTNTKTGGLILNGTISGSNANFSSMTVTGGTISANGFDYVFPSSSPSQGQIWHVDSVSGKKINTVWGGDNAGSGGGGGSGTESSTFTMCLCGFGTVFNATSSYKIAGGTFQTTKSTINITSSMGYTSIISTMPVKFYVGRSTEVAGTNVSFQTIDSASYTVTNQLYSPIKLPDTITRILAGERLNLFASVLSSDTNPASGQWGVVIEYWKESGKGP